MNLEQLRGRCCTGKRTLGANAARSLSAASHASPGPDGPVSAYRCPFAAEHRDDGEWHVGHQPSMEMIQQIAQLLRERTGNAPPPGDQTPPPR